MAPGGFAFDSVSGHELVTALEAHVDRIEEWSARVAALAHPLPLGANPVGEAMSARFSAWAQEHLAPALASYRATLERARDAVRDSMALYSSADDQYAGDFR